MPDYNLYNEWILEKIKRGKNRDYFKYYFDGRDSAIWLLDKLKRHKELKDINILDWGCGPSRIVRHLPELLDKSCSIYGTDYNPKSIAWNRKALMGINFNLNSTNPPLPYVDSSFDIVYGISIFTHLPEDLHYKWFNELVRITKKNGIVFLTLHGNVFKAKLTVPEQQVFDAGQLIIKGNTKIGHRTYAAFHPNLFVHKLFSEHPIIEHIEGTLINGMPQQDVWIIKVNKEKRENNR
jgi:Methylase involved in ubiquinone/menaquinone biosynthesis